VRRIVNRSQAVVDILLSILLFIASAFAAGLLVGVLVPPKAQLVATLVLQGLLVMLGLRVLLRWRACQWADLGLQRIERRDVWRGLSAFGLCLGASAALTSVIYVVSPDTVTEHLRRLATVTTALSGSVPLAATAAVLLWVAVYEEVLARGMLLGRARVLTVAPWHAVLASALLFGLGHLYQGWLGILQTTALGVVLGALTLRWGSLWPAILAHASLNLMSVVELGRMP
jgi:membrane protease YdiL (CAAX protease family)